MSSQPSDVVTGAFSFTGRHVAERLLEDDRRVVTLTNHPDRTTHISDGVRADPYRFDDPAAMAESMAGAETLYNTFWMRTPESGRSFDTAVEYSRVLVRAAEAAGLERIVHFSVSNAGASDLPYYRGKATVEGFVADSSLSHAILRPTLIFGRGDLLVNNLAWFLRVFPCFVVFGSGDYRVQPVFVGDVADVAVAQGNGTEDVTVDVAGPETYTFEVFLRHLLRALGVRCRLVHLPPRLASLAVEGAERVLGDVVLTRDEAQGLMDELLVTETEPRGETGFCEWLDSNAPRLGRGYTSFRARYEM